MREFHSIDQHDGIKREFHSGSRSQMIGSDGQFPEKASIFINGMNQHRKCLKNTPSNGKENKTIETGFRFALLF